eukprot:scaffold31529_cov33-Attheya_sp.AAC.1
MPRRQGISYKHKSGTGHHSNKRRITAISSISGHPSSDRSSLVDTPLPPPIPPDTAAAMAIADPFHPLVLHTSSESSRSTVLNANSIHSTSSSSSISMTDTNSNSNGVLSTSSARLPSTSNSPPNTALNAFSSSTSLSLNKNKSIGVASSASTPLLDPRNKSELTNFRRLILNSSTTTLSNASPTSLCNYKSLLKERLNLVESKLNGSSITSPPAS